MSDIKNYETMQEFIPELHQALMFDLRDNPDARNILNYFVDKYGKDGERRFLITVEEDVRREFSKADGPMLFPWTRAAIKTYITGGELHSQFGMGQWAALIGAAITALAQVGGSVYTSKLAASTQLKITKLQVDQANANNAAQAAVVQKQIDAQQAALNAQTAKEAATQNSPFTGTPIVPSSWVSEGSIFGDMPTMLMMAGLAATVGYIIMHKVRN